MTPFHVNGRVSRSSNCFPEDVLAAKHALNRLGFYDVPEWGIADFPDRQLMEAITAFQKSRGLRVDGAMRPGGETEAAIQGDLRAAAARLRELGRHGDTILAHITPEEAMFLHRVTDGGTINPETGLPEFFDFGGMFSGIGEGLSNFGNSLANSFSSMTDGISDFFSGSGKTASGLADSVKAPDIGSSLGNAVKVPDLGSGMASSIKAPDLGSGLANEVKVPNLGNAAPQPAEVSIMSPHRP
ncbi:MAG: peptidoglycan-binding protein [Alphaproteobacteria bacterium]|nr:peptidoglycan-binding protein [Alphaproteobacteria bacterium]